MRGARTVVVKVVPFVAGCAILLGAWELIGRFEVFPSAWPPLSDVLGRLFDSQKNAVIGRSARATADAAFRGLAVGAACGVAIALVGVTFRRTREGIEAAMTAGRAIPIIAYAPILIVTVGRQLAPLYAAAVLSAYPVWLSVSRGLLGAPKTYSDVGSAFGATHVLSIRWMLFPNAIPSLLDGLRLGAPAAVIGAVIGEWFGTETGLGVLIYASVLNNQLEQLWAAAVVATLLSAVAYGFISGGLAIVLRRRAL